MTRRYFKALNFILIAAHPFYIDVAKSDEILINNCTVYSKIGSFIKGHPSNKINLAQCYIDGGGGGGGAGSSCDGSCRTLDECAGWLICINGKCNDDPDVGTHVCSRFSKT